MKNIKNYILQFIFFFFLANGLTKSFAQQQKIDSLLSVLKTVQADTIKVNTLNHLSRLYSNTGNYDQAVQNAQQALQQSEKLIYKKGMAAAYNNIGVVYWSKANYESALDVFLKSLKIWQEINNKKGIANCYNNVGLIYWNLGNYEMALNNLLISLKIWEAIGDKDGLAMSYLNIGNIYYNQTNYEKALEFYSKSLKIDIEIGNKNSEATNLNNIGIIYGYKGNTEKALENHQKALKIREEIKDKRGVAMSYNNIGLVYYDLNNYKKALDNQLKSVEINKEIGNTQGIAVSYSNIGNIYAKQKKFEDALYYNNQSLSLCKSIGYKEGIKDAYASLSDIFYRKGDFKQAFDYHKLFSTIKDTLFNEQSSKQITEMNAKYDSEKKDKELIKKDAALNIQQAETEKQNIQRNAFIVGFGLVLFLALFILRSYKQKQKANRLLDEKNTQITDSINYALHIQEAMLPSINEIKKHFPESFILYLPKDIVSGDFYWISPKGETVKEEGVLIAAVDCIGHGVPGAFMSVMAFNMLENIVSEKNLTQPASMLDELNKVVLETLRQDTENSSAKYGMDIAMLNIHKDRNSLRFSGAHNPLCIIRNGNLIEVKADKTTIGMAKEKFTNNVVEIQKGDMLYLFTDGYADQKGGPENKKFFAGTFRDVLKDIATLPADEQKIRMENNHKKWKGNFEQIDDILIVGIRI